LRGLRTADGIVIMADGELGIAGSPEALREKTVDLCRCLGVF
jgi:hypothetical protein